MNTKKKVNEVTCGWMRISVDKNRITMFTPFGVGRARCHPGDEFDLFEGIDICAKRIVRGYKKRHGNRQ